MKIYWHEGSKNIIGKKLTQKEIAVRLQLKGYECDRLTVLRIENGLRLVPVSLL